MRGYTIQNSINLLEKEKGGGAGGASSAADVSFDNTGTGIVATNVQNAITEINGKFPVRVSVPFTNVDMALGTPVTISQAALDVGSIQSITGSFVVDGYTYSIPDINFRVDITPTKELQITAPSTAMNGISGGVIIEHVPTPAPSEAKTTRKKK